MRASAADGDAVRVSLALRRYWLLVVWEGKLGLLEHVDSETLHGN